MIESTKTASPPQAAAAPRAHHGPLLAPMLAFAAGYVDAVGFSAFSGLFTAHVTGNFIMIGIALAGHQAGLLAKLLALPTFIAAVAATRLAEARLVRAGRAPVPALLLAECVFLMLSLMTGVGGASAADPGGPTAIAAGLLAVVAMGIQNALSRTALAEAGPTTIMTGNTTQIVIDVVDAFGASAQQRAAIRTRLSKLVSALAGFALGAIAGALAYAGWSIWSVLVPLSVLAIIDVRLWRQARLAVG